MSHSKRILHLEDDPEWIEIVRSTLKGYTINSVHNLKDAAKMASKLASQKKFDLAILDISLTLGDSQDIQGERFLKALRGLSIIPSKRIIILSAYLLIDPEQKRIRKYFKLYRVFDAIPKQKFDSKEFRKIVDEALHTKN
jgi:CheY-like chemotaxis protein